jgi:hypothetical protein
VHAHLDDADGRLEIWNSADCAAEAEAGTETET